MHEIKVKWIIASKDKVYKNHGVLWNHNKIEAILPHKQIDKLLEKGCLADITVLAEGILLPGFINAHMHQYGILSRGIPVAGEVVDFETFLKNYWWPYIEDQIGKEEVLAERKSGV